MRTKPWGWSGQLQASMLYINPSAVKLAEWKHRRVAAENTKEGVWRRFESESYFGKVNYFGLLWTVSPRV